MIPVDSLTAELIENGRCSCVLSQNECLGSESVHPVYCSNRWVCDAHIRSVTRMPEQASLAWWVRIASTMGLTPDRLKTKADEYMQSHSCRYSDLCLVSFRIT